MVERISVVTGANAGIGKALALGLAKSGGTLVMICRDRQRGEAAQGEIKTLSGNASIDLLIANLSSQQSIRQLADELKRKYAKLDVLLNNAGVYKAARTTTVDGLETMFATNHLAPFLLTHLLLDPLQTSGAARVLTISAPSSTRLDFDDLQGVRKFGSLNAFGASKSANLLFTFEAAKRFQDKKICVNAIHPGLVRSNLMQDANALMRGMLWLISKPAEKAAEGIVRVATAPEYTGQTGRFYHNGKEIQAPEYTRGEDVQKRLWEVSEQLTGVQAAG